VWQSPHLLTHHADQLRQPWSCPWCRDVVVLQSIVSIQPSGRRCLLDAVHMALLEGIFQANTSFPGIETKFVFIAPSTLATRLFSFEVPGLAWVNEWTWRARYEGKVSNRFSSLGLSRRALGLFGGSQRDIVAVQSVYPTTKPCLLIADPVTVKVCTGAERRRATAQARAPRQLDRVTPISQAIHAYLCCHAAIRT
jgi:hypothetical protein